MIRLDDEGFFRPDQVGPSVFDQFEYPEELEVVGVVVLFCGGEGGGVICNRVPLPWGNPFRPPVL